MLVLPLKMLSDAKEALTPGPGLHFPRCCVLGLDLVWAPSRFQEPGPVPQSRVPMSIHAEHYVGGEARVLLQL